MGMINIYNLTIMDINMKAIGWNCSFCKKVCIFLNMIMKKKKNVKKTSLRQCLIPFPNYLSEANPWSHYNRHNIGFAKTTPSEEEKPFIIEAYLKKNVRLLSYILDFLNYSNYSLDLS